MTKEKVKAQIDLLPEEFSLDELIDRFILIDKAERGAQDFEQGNTITEQELDIEMSKWFK
ncbi:MAG: hypothetical protein AAFW89_01925 [Bacteroidota bacterium]